MGGGNPMIALCKANYLSGGRGNISSISCSAFLFIFVTFGYPLLNFIPVSCFVGVMFVVVIHTFRFDSIGIILITVIPNKYQSSTNTKYNLRINRVDVLVILVVTVITYVVNLVYAIIIGSAIAAFAFSWRAAQDLKVTGHLVDAQCDSNPAADPLEGMEAQPLAKVYKVRGPLAFANTLRLFEAFDYVNDPPSV